MVSHTVWTLFKPLMKATALSRRPNDRINERPATMIALVRATAVVLTLCIMYSCCCNVFFFFGTHTQNTHTHTKRACLYQTSPHHQRSILALCSMSFTSKQGDASNEGWVQLQVQADHYQLQPSSFLLSNDVAAVQCAVHFSPAIPPPFSHFSPLSHFSLSFTPSPPHS